MSCIPYGYRVGNRRRNGFRRRFRRRDLAGSQNLFDGGDDLAKKLVATKQVTTCQPDLPFRISGRLSCNSESYGNDCIELEQVRNVIDKGQRLSCMNESDCRRIAGCQHCCLGDAIQTGGVCRPHPRFSDRSSWTSSQRRTAVPEACRFP